MICLLKSITESGYLKVILQKQKKKANNTQYVFNEVDKTITQLMEFCKNEGFRSYEICKFIHENYY